MALHVSGMVYGVDLFLREVRGVSPLPRALPPRGADFAIFASRCIVVTMEGEAVRRAWRLVPSSVLFFWTGWMEIIPPGIVNILIFGGG